MPLKSVLRKCCFGMRSETLEFNNIQNVSKDNLVSHVAEMDKFDWSKENVYDNNITIFRTVSSDSEPDFKFLDHLSSLPRKKGQNDYVESILLSAPKNSNDPNDVSNKEALEEVKAKCILCSEIADCDVITDTTVSNIFGVCCKKCQTREFKNRKYLKSGMWDPGNSPRTKNGIKSHGVYILNQDVNNKAFKDYSSDKNQVQLLKQLDKIPATHRNVLFDFIDNHLDNYKRADNFEDIETSQGRSSVSDSQYYQSVDTNGAALSDQIGRQSMKDHDYESLGSKSEDDINGEVTHTKCSDKSAHFSYTERSENIISLGPIDSVRASYISKQNLTPSLSLGVLEVPKHLKERRPSFTPRRRSQSLVSESAVNVEKFGKKLYMQEWLGRISKWQKFYSEECLDENDDDYDDIHDIDNEVKNNIYQPFLK